MLYPIMSSVIEGGDGEDISTLARSSSQDKETA